ADGPVGTDHAALERWTGKVHDVRAILFRQEALDQPHLQRFDALEPQRGGRGAGTWFVDGEQAYAGECRGESAERFKDPSVVSAVAQDRTPFEESSDQDEFLPARTRHVRDE